MTWNDGLQALVGETQSFSFGYMDEEKWMQTFFHFGEYYLLLYCLGFLNIFNIL